MRRMGEFADRLNAAIARHRAPCVVGLDPVLEYIPDDFLRECGLSREGELEERARAIEAYCLLTLEAVHGLVPAVKPQMAYFEPYGSFGMRALERCIETARALDMMVLLDGKRGDIGSTSKAYAEAYLAKKPVRPFEVDCMTLNPYLGRDSLEPFVDVALENGKGLFVCVRTSNPGADVIQLQRTEDGRHVYEVVADLVNEFNARSIGESGFGSVGAVVGATQAEAASKLRARMPKTLFLVPGFGAQGGALDTVRACFDERGQGAIVNSSRAVMYPARFGGAGHETGRVAIRTAAEELVSAVRSVLSGRKGQS
jgi:orotidine-5'-phosphate decarboxylase